ncbi:aspartyl/asparaginyl beta-hydroxylase domain-containing protein [Sphingomonas sp. PR090111-T3T-6A]|uniref:aspartyl/asparaginyl beta-hydroxylase domain-containing protein n=1 Tax=Sphingomonas sp. PR090111-T3T-6A TaxID=685778 RepID=UPI00036F0198|nr:aspartyl/asparaginyl beta-hydroxylase domain-containing protein [Sphingomonas sp. PR090111-T3T-6A]
MDVGLPWAKASETKAPIERKPAAQRANPLPRRPLILRIGKKLRRTVDRVVEKSSLVSNGPVLDAADFPWTAMLRTHWREIRDEAMAVARNPDVVPALSRISPDHARIAPTESWRSFFLVGYGARIEPNIARCPKTMAVLDRIPGLNSGFFSILRPGTHIPRHRGVTKGLMTCHLGLVVPPGPLRMQVDGRTVGWAEGETLLFDDTWPHEVWNDTGGTRIVLLVQFARPLRQPGRALASAFLAGIRRSPFVKEAVDNIALWEESMKRVEQAAN